jgi:hypothetical protein
VRLSVDSDGKLQVNGSSTDRSRGLARGGGASHAHQMAVLNARALRLMSEQFSVASRPQLLACGLTEDQVDSLVQRGGLEKLLCGTYRVPGAAVPAEQYAMAAVLRCRPRAWVTGPFVLGLLRIEGFTVADPFEVIVPPGRRVQRVPFTVRCEALPAHSLAAIGPLPAVTATRALIDTARGVNGRRLVSAVDSARWLGLTRVDRLLRTAEQLRRHPGAKRIRELIATGTLDYESEGERTVATIFADYDPPLEPQVWITPRIRVDFVWQDVRMILEFDGQRRHSLGADRDEDRARDRELRRLGYHVEHVTTADLANPSLLRARVLAVRRTLVRARRSSA